MSWLLLGVALVLLAPPRRQRHAAASPRSTGLPLALDLAASALRAGRDVGSALRLAAAPVPEAVRGAWLQVAGLLQLGADPEQVWTLLAAEPVLAPVAAAARRSATSGARLAHAFTQLAGEVRAGQRASALARAHRAGVLAMAPVGLCFLPAFVCLGVVPTVAGIASGVLGTLP